MKPTERLDELDGIFDLLLVLLSIITAAMFQHLCTVEPLRITQLNPNLSESELFQTIDTQMTIWLRVFFIPLVLLIGVWIFNRISLRTRITFRKAISEFCYLMAFAILSYDIYAFIGVVTFYPLQYAFQIIGVITGLQLLSSLGLVYSYEIVFINRENIRTRKETWKRIWSPLLIRVLILWGVTFYLTFAITYLCRQFY